MEQKYLYNGMNAHERTRQMRLSMKKASQAINEHGAHKLTAVVVAAVFQDGSIILEGSGPAGAIGELGRMIYIRSEEAE